MTDKFENGDIVEEYNTTPKGTGKDGIPPDNNKSEQPSTTTTTTNKKDKKSFKHFWVQLARDVANRNLLPLKILFFFKYATVGVLYPYLTLHMDSLGLSEWEIGVNQAITPVVSILGPPVAGLLADKIGNFKILLSVVTLVTAGVSLLLLLVPVARETVRMPGNITFEIKCGPDTGMPSSSSEQLQFILASLEPYYYACTGNRWSTLPRNNNVVQCQKLCRRKLDNVTTQAYSTINNFSKLVTVEWSDLSGSINGTTKVVMPPVRFVDSESPPMCSWTSSDGDLNPEVECKTECYLHLKRDSVCDNSKVTTVHNVPLSFGLYVWFRLLWGFCSAVSFIMFEGAVLAILMQHGGDYGLQRVTASLAATITAPLSGWILQNYRFEPVFYLYAALQSFSALVTMAIDLKFKAPAQNVLSNLKTVLAEVEIFIFFAAMFVSGMAWGHLETFLFLFLKQLGASESLMGLSISIGGLFGIPCLIFSRPIIKRLGYVNVICIGLLFYGIRLFGFSFIENPWLSLIFEALESITCSLAITSACTYAVALSNMETIASVHGTFAAVYFGIGRGSGSLIGGFLVREFGHRSAFQILGTTSLVAFLSYFLVNIFYLKRHSKTNSSTGININNMDRKTSSL